MNSATRQQKCVTLKQYPKGRLNAGDFEFGESSVPALAEGQFLVRNIYVSVEPMLRLAIDPSPLGGAFPPLPLGAVVPGPAVGEIVESRHAEFMPGELVEGRFGWQLYAASNGTNVRRVGPHVRPIYDALGAYGLPGFTAYVGLHCAGGVKPGQGVLVSGAGGAVGSIVGALVRARGGRAVGIASGRDKQTHLTEVGGYEAVADRSAPDFLDQLKKALPNGADIYFDNVGGPLLATVASLMAPRGKILICGVMSQYQRAGEAAVDRLAPLLETMMARSLSMEAFSQVGQDALRPEFEREMRTLISAGKIKPEVHIEQGLEQLPSALCGLFDKSRAGKVIVRVADESSASAGQSAR